MVGAAEQRLSYLRKIQSPLRGSESSRVKTQRSQSLALGLALPAAPQLVERDIANTNREATRSGRTFVDLFLTQK
jgi:hypothetical protein